MGTELELPLWLVLECSIGRQPIVAPELPKFYKEAYREILKADATAVDLNKFNFNFYEMGSYVKHFDKKGDVHDILLHVSSITVYFKLSYLNILFTLDFYHKISLDNGPGPQFQIWSDYTTDTGYVRKEGLQRWSQCQDETK